jgi:hypothetical protein
VTDDDFRTLALGLPETSEGEHSGLPTFLVAGKRFATLSWPKRRQVAVVLGLDEQEMLLAACPDAVRRAPGSWGRRGHTHLDLAEADGATVASVLRMAWRRAAPPPLAKTLEG